MGEELEALIGLYTLSTPAPSHRKSCRGPPVLAGGRGANVLDDEDALWAADELDAERRKASAVVTSKQGAFLAPFWAAKYEADARKAWDRFYKKHGANYRDRHYIDEEWPGAFRAEAGVWLEVGCGNGAAVFPVLADHRGWRAVAVDFAQSAVDLVRADARFDGTRCRAAVADGSVDVVTCLFVLSAMGPDARERAVANLWRALRPGGRLLFRDYGRYDHAQLRFAKGCRIAEDFYVKGDGTRVFYFDEDDVRRAFAAFEIIGVGLRCRQEVNRATRERRRRVFAQGEFVKK